MRPNFGVRRDLFITDVDGFEVSGLGDQHHFFVDDVEVTPAEFAQRLHEAGPWEPSRIDLADPVVIAQQEAKLLELAERVATERV